MRKIALVILLLGVASLPGCGGSSSTDCTAAEEAAIRSFDSFGTIIEDATIQQCVAQVQTDCPCPVSGNVVTDLAESTLTWTSCTAADNSVFTGTMTASADLTTFTVNMTTFGECTNVASTGITPNTCGGQITAVCSGQNLTCTLVEDATGGCTLECTC